MTQSLQRQRRLLAVRSLQADFAVAEVRRSQLEAEAASGLLQKARYLARAEHGQSLSGGNAPEEWVLRCAEQELAGFEIDRQVEALQAIDARTAELSLQEQKARREREQIKFVCERLERTAAYVEQVREQSTLDDLFNASSLRRRIEMTER